MNMKETFQMELNEVLNKLSRYENMLEMMDNHPPINKIDKEIAETLCRAYETTSNILMELERKMN